MLDMIDAASLQWARESRVLQVKLQNLSSRATYQTAVHTTHKHACEELLDHICRSSFAMQHSWLEKSRPGIPRSDDFFPAANRHARELTPTATIVTVPPSILQKISRPNMDRKESAAAN